MFSSHAWSASNDIDRSKTLLRRGLFEQGAARTDDKGRLVYRHNGAVFMVTKPIDGEPAHARQRRHGRLQLRQPRRGRRLAPARARGRRHRRSRIRPAIASCRSASSTSPICAIPTATSSAGCTGRQQMTLEIVSREQVARRAAAGRHAMRRPRPSTDMTFSIFLPPQAERGGKLPVVWYLSGLTCTHANVTEKGEYRAACAEHRPDLRRARHQPARRRRARRRRPMISARAPASTSMRREEPWAAQFPHVELCHRRAAGAGRRRVPGRHGRARRSPAIRWAAMAR